MALTGEEIFKLRSKWPKCLSRPQDLHLRLRLEQCENNTNPNYPDENPRKKEIVKWKPPLVDPDKIYAMLDMKTAKRVCVKTEDRLKWVSTLIEESREFAVDIKWDEQNSFLYSMALLQIAIPTHVFIIDPYPLHGAIHQYLKPLFEDPSIVKVFHGHENDNLRLQSCFHIYTTGIIDTQVAHTYIYKTKIPISFEDAIFYYLGESAAETINKDFNWADFRVRIKPFSDSFLPPELESYCGVEAQLLLRLWSFQKHGIEAYAKLAKIHAKDVLISIYDSYKPTLLSTFTNDFFNSYVQLNYDVKPEDFHHFQVKTFLEKKRYVLIHNWRMEKAKTFDTTPFQIISNLDTSLTAKNNPTNSHELTATLTNIPRFIVRYGVEKFISEVLQHFSYRKENSLPTFEELIQIADPPAKFALSKMKSEYEALSVLVNSIAKQTQFNSAFTLPLDFLNKLITKPTVADLMQMKSKVQAFSSGNATSKENPSSHSLGLIAKNYETPSLDLIAKNYYTASTSSTHVPVTPTLTPVTHKPTPVTTAPIRVPPPVRVPQFTKQNPTFSNPVHAPLPQSRFSLRPSSAPIAVKKVLPMPQQKPVNNVTPIRNMFQTTPKPQNIYTPTPVVNKQPQPQPFFARQSPSIVQEPREEPESDNYESPNWTPTSPTYRPKHRAPRLDEPIFQICRDPVGESKRGRGRGRGAPFINNSRIRPGNSFGGPPQNQHGMCPPAAFGGNRHQMNQDGYGDSDKYSFAMDRETGPSSEGRQLFGRNHRTADNEVICDYCNEVGHVKAYCHSRKSGLPSRYEPEPPGCDNAPFNHSSGPQGYFPPPKMPRFNDDISPPGTFNSPVAQIRPLMGPRGPFNPGRFRPPAQTSWVRRF